MKIDSNISATNLGPAEWSAKQQLSKSASAAASSGAEDRTTFSSTTTAVQTLTAQAMNVPEVRQNVVDALRKSVSEGTYQLNPHAIAEAISNGQ